MPRTLHRAPGSHSSSRAPALPRAPHPGGCPPLRTPGRGRPPLPRARPRLLGLGAGVTRAGSCSGAAEDASGTTPVRLRPGRPWPVPASASSCRGFSWPAGAGPARGRGGRQGRRPRRLPAPLPSAPRGRGNGREEGAGKEWRAESRLPAPPGPGQRPGARGSGRGAAGAWRPARAAQKGKGKACCRPPHPIGFPKESSGASQHLNKISK